jgi:nitroreductase
MDRLDVTTPQADQLERLLEDRWSCRAFSPEPVPRPVIERMLTIAQRSPSWCNTQPWSLIVTSGDATERFRTGLRAHAGSSGGAPTSDFPMPERYEGVYRERRREVGWQLYESVGIERGDRAASRLQTMKNFDLFGAPHAAIITTDAGQGVYGAVDTGLYVLAFILAAQSLGLGAIPQAALAHHGQFVREHFQIPEDRNVLLGISFGYPDLEHPANRFRSTRADLAEVVEWQS